MLRARIEGRLADTDGNAFLCQQHLPVRAAVALPVDQPKLPAPDIGVGETRGDAQLVDNHTNRFDTASGGGNGLLDDVHMPRANPNMFRIGSTSELTNRDPSWMLVHDNDVISQCPLGEDHLHSAGKLDFVLGQFFSPFPR
jgi:hypothetical protein